MRLPVEGIIEQIKGQVQVQDPEGIQEDRIIVVRIHWITLWLKKSGQEPAIEMKLKKKLQGQIIIGPIEIGEIIQIEQSLQ